MTTAQQTWTQTGKDYTEGEQRPTAAAAIDGLQWVSPEGSFPMAPGLAIKKCITELRIPKVSAVAWQGGYIGPYEVLGIEGNYKNGRVRVYVLDRGADLLVLRSDLWPNEPT